MFSHMIHGAMLRLGVVLKDCTVARHDVLASTHACVIKDEWSCAPMLACVVDADQ